MGYISGHDTRKALELFNRLYADGKDVGALLDEMACLTRDLLILQTAPKAGLSMLSGIANDAEASYLSDAFSNGELLRMMKLLEQTMQTFTRSASRRLDVELCIMSLCQPQLQLDVQGINARLSKLEEQIKTGNFSVSKLQSEKSSEPVVPEEKEVEIPIPESLPEELKPEMLTDEAPVGFWTEVVSAMRKDLKPPVVGFFVTADNAPVQGVLHGNQLILRCVNQFAFQMIDKPDVLAMVQRKASAILGRNVTVSAQDITANPMGNSKMEQLLNFGRDHSDVIKVNE